MTRDEFILQRLKDEMSMYRVLFAVCVLAAVAGAALAAYAVVAGDVPNALPFLGMACGFGVTAYASKSKVDSLSPLHEQFKDDPTGLATRRDFPRETVLVIAGLQKRTKEYLQMTIAYGICSAMLLAGGIVIYAVSDWEDAQPLFIALGTLLVLGFVWLAVLAFQSFRNWRNVTELYGK